MNPILNRPRPGSTPSGKSVVSVCDGCKKKFRLDAIKYKTRPHPTAKSIQISEWCCPWCGMKYPYMATDAEQRERIETLRQLRDKQRGYRGMKNKALYTITVKKITALEEAIEARGKELKAEYIVGDKAME